MMMFLMIIIGIYIIAMIVCGSKMETQLNELRTVTDHLSYLLLYDSLPDSQKKEIQKSVRSKRDGD